MTDNYSPLPPWSVELRLVRWAKSVNRSQATHLRCRFRLWLLTRRLEKLERAAKLKQHLRMEKP